MRAQGRRVNSGVNRMCAHGDRATRHQAMRSARSGWAGEGRPACSVSRVAVPERCGGADARSVRGPGCRAQEEGLRASVSLSGGRPGCVLTPGSSVGAAGPTPVSASALLLQCRPPAVGEHRSRTASRYATPAVSQAPTSRRSRAARIGGSAGPGGRMEQRRSPGTLPGARRALPRARPPARPPAPS